MCMLNLISAAGLFVMIGLAWLMSSYRDRVDWRLVVWGVLLQLAFALIFFSSQSWTFPRSFETQAEVDAAAAAGLIDPEKVVSPSGNETRYLVPRYDRGIVFYWVESFFNLIQQSVEAGSSFVFETHPDPADNDPPTHPRALLTTFAFGIFNI